MSADDYLNGILAREAVDAGPSSPVRKVQTALFSTINEWSGGMLVSVRPSGSFAKGTANRSGTDIDLFISLSEKTSETLKEIYESLFKRMGDVGLSPKRQNVSINVTVNGYDVDLVPGKRQGTLGDDHSLWRRRADTWTKTNVTKHIGHVRAAGRISETRILKLWRNQQGLDFPSFYLELTVIDALSVPFIGTVSNRVWRVFQYLRDRFPSARVVDPANTHNIISDDLTVADRGRIKAADERALAAKTWGEIVR